jgi:hypothetical protein
MQKQHQSKTVTQFRGLHAMSATAVPNDRQEKAKRAAAPVASTQTAQAPKRNAA